MAIRLQFLNLIMRRSSVARCRELPWYCSDLNKRGGSILGMAWYDEHLCNSTSMSGFDTDAELDEWIKRGLDPCEFCVLSSRSEPQCEWLDYDPAENCVWLKGTRRGLIIGGLLEQEKNEKRLASRVAAADDAWSRWVAGRRTAVDSIAATIVRAARLALFMHEVTCLETQMERLREIVGAHPNELPLGLPDSSQILVPLELRTLLRDPQGARARIDGSIQSCNTLQSLLVRLGDLVSLEGDARASCDVVGNNPTLQEIRVINTMLEAILPQYGVNESVAELRQCTLLGNVPYVLYDYHPQTGRVEGHAEVDFSTVRELAKLAFLNRSA